jgi:uncharacterized protein YcbK (DUF882 family)
MKYGISKNFNRAEFRCPCGCKFDSVDSELLLALEDVREYFNAPITITSGNRCESHNSSDAVKGSKHSFHVRGLAADFKVSGKTPQEVADYLNSQYPNTYGIGVYSTWTHLDVRVIKGRWNSE